MGRRVSCADAVEIGLGYEIVGLLYFVLVLYLVVLLRSLKLNDLRLYVS